MDHQLDLVDYLKMTRELNGSDLHISADVPPAARVDGTLQPLTENELSPDDTKDLILGILTETQRAKLEESWELDFALQVEGAGRFRGNAHFVRGRMEASFRHIPEVIPDLRALGHGDSVEELCKLRQGLILLTGMTGSGKTTTLASMVQRIADNRSCVIITIEDPIEYIFEHSYGIVKQRQIGTDTKSFPAALRSALRQDPDVILVSELRDLETIQTAVTAAETGHLVMSTVHTIDAPKALDRVIDVFPADQQSQITTQLANVLQAVISQKLIPRADQSGRVLATEIMRINHGIRSVIVERRFQQLIGLIQVGAKDGMHTFDDSLTFLLQNGHISLEEALANCREQATINEKYQEMLAAAAAAAAAQRRR